MKLLALLVLAGVLATPVAAAPEGFRQSTPLTLQAVKVGGNPIVTVHCSRTTAIWRETASSEEASTAAGRTNLTTREVMLPTGRCATLERWLKGKTVDMTLLSDALFTFGHELAHAATGTRDEAAADCYASLRFNTIARAFGVKRATTLRQLRNDAPLDTSLC